MTANPGLIAFPRARARSLGIAPGSLPPGETNCITDVPGVLVGHQTINEGRELRTGVTTILPHEGNLFRDRVPAALFTANGFGKFVGATQLAELGELEVPIVLTGTLSAFRVADAVVSYVLAQPENGSVTSVNPVVGETNDGYLSNIRARPITEDHVWAAIEGASDSPPAEGSVGAGTGTVCFGWKGGIGSSSRQFDLGGQTRLLGVLVQSNFGGSLRILGVPVGDDLPAPRRQATGPGSCMIVVATDAPLDARQLKRLASRAAYGLARVGSSYSHGSGDYAIAFSTVPGDSLPAKDDSLNEAFQAALEATEEAVLNSLFCATTVSGFQGHRAEAIPLPELIALCASHGVLNPQAANEASSTEE